MSEGFTFGNYKPTPLTESQIAELQRLLQEHPELCSEKHLFQRSCSSTYLLQELCRRSAPLHLIELAYKAFPEAIKGKGISDKTPLQWAYCSSASLDVVQFLVRMEPEALARRRFLMPTVLHLACENQAPLDVVKFLVEQRPDDVIARNRNGMLPIHFACGRPDALVEVVEFLATWDPTSLRMQTRGFIASSGCSLPYQEVEPTPLHFACGEGAPLPVVQCLVASYPEAVRMKTGSRHFLPLHLACAAKNTSHEVVQFLVRLYPDAVKQIVEGIIGRKGFTPLLLGCLSYPRLDVIQFLVDEFPAALEIADTDGFIPLLAAVGSGSASIPVVQFLLKRCPDTLVRTTNYGSTVLHVASTSVLPFLVEKYPEALGMSDKDGELPLHLACRKCAPLEIIQLLMERNPTAVKQANHAGDLPLHVACCLRASLKLIQLLIKEYPTAVKQANEAGDLPLHVLCTGCRFASALRLDVINCLVGQFPDALKTPNKRKETPFNLAFNYMVPKGEVSTHMHRLSHISDCEPEDFESMREPEYLEYMLGSEPTRIHFLQALTPRFSGTIKTIHAGITSHLPLHFLASLPYSSRLVDAANFLIEKDPEATEQTNDLGETPLHVTCRSNASLELARLFFKNCPQALQIANNNGFLPLHLACQNDAASLDLLFFLVKNFPIFVFQRQTPTFEGLCCAVDTNRIDVDGAPEQQDGKGPVCRSGCPEPPANELNEEGNGHSHLFKCLHFLLPVKSSLRHQTHS